MTKKINNDPNDFFITEHLERGLKGRAVRGGATALAAQGIKFSLTLASNIILARLLTPADYGLIGMVTAVIGFVTLFKDLGLSMATVQKEDISHEQVSTLFWVNVIFSVSIACITIALSPLIAKFYGEPRLIGITAALAIGIAIGGLGVQHAALMKRQMHYTSLALIDTISQFISLSIAISTAYRGIGYWALVIYPLVNALANNIGYWLVCKWRPGLPDWQSGIKSMLIFGGNMTGFSIVNYFSRNLDNILIGRYWGSQQLGIYAKAYQLFLLPLNQINIPLRNVAIPLLSRLTHSPKIYKKTYLRIFEKILILTTPLVLFMIAASDWLIEIILGDQWLVASPIFQWLGIVGLFQPAISSTGWLFVSQAKTKEMFIWGLVSSTLTLTSFIIGIPWGAKGVAISYAIFTICVNMPLLLWFVGYVGLIPTKEIYATLAPITLALVSTSLSLFAFHKWIEITNPVRGILATLVITSLTYLFALLISSNGRHAIRDLKAITFDLRSIK